MSVQAFKGVPGNQSIGGVAHPLQNFPRPKMGGHGGPDEVGYTLLHGNLDLLPDSGLAAPVEGAKNPDGQVNSGPAITNGRAAFGGGIFWKSGVAHSSSGGLGNNVKAWVSMVGALGTETRDGRINNIGVDGLQNRIVNPQPLHSADHEVGNYNVCFPNH